MTRYVAMEPGDAQGHKILGLSHFVLGRTDRAEPELRRAIELDPRDPEAHYHLGRLFYNRNDFAAALEAFDQVIELDSNSVRTFNHLGQTKQALGEFAGARDAYLKAIQLEQQQSARSGMAVLQPRPALHYGRASRGSGAILATSAGTKTIMA